MRLTANEVGCVIGKDVDHGVIDPYHRVWNYPTLHIVDGLSVTAILGVNPLLTITAQAERASLFWPNKGEADTRPVQEIESQRLDPIAPRHKVVPLGAYGSLTQ